MSLCFISFSGPNNSGPDFAELLKPSLVPSIALQRTHARLTKHLAAVWSCRSRLSVKGDLRQVVGSKGRGEAGWL